MRHKRAGRNLPFSASSLYREIVVERDVQYWTMSPWIGLLILVLGSASALDSGDVIRSSLTNNLVSAMALSRLTPGEMSIDGRDQLGGRSSSPVAGEYKKMFNARKWFNHFPNCLRPLRGGLTQQKRGKAHDLIRVTKRSHIAMIMAMSRQGPHEVNSFQQKFGKSGTEKKTQEKNKRQNKKPLTKLPNYWFKVCTNCPKHTWFLQNLEEKEAAAAEAVRTTVIRQAVLRAL